MPRRSAPARRHTGWQVAGANVAAYAGARFHTRVSVLPDLPFSSGDVAGVIGVEFHEQSAYWQFLLGGVRNPGSDEMDLQYALSPEINLLLKDRMFVGGAGLRWSYLSSRSEPSEWSKTYYQFLFGLQFGRAQRLSFSVLAHYPFAQWSRVKDFKGSDLEYSGGLSFRF